MNSRHEDSYPAGNCLSIQSHERKTASPWLFRPTAKVCHSRLPSRLERSAKNAPNKNKMREKPSWGAVWWTSSVHANQWPPKSAQRQTFLLPAGLFFPRFAQQKVTRKYKDCHKRFCGFFLSTFVFSIAATCCEEASSVLTSYFGNSFTFPREIWVFSPSF